MIDEQDMLLASLLEKSAADLQTITSESINLRLENISTMMLHESIVHRSRLAVLVRAFNEASCERQNDGIIGYAASLLENLVNLCMTGGYGTIC